MSSGIQASEECGSAFQDLKSGKLKFISYKIGTDDKTKQMIVVEDSFDITGKKDIDNKEAYERFVETLKGKGEQAQCRYGVFDFEYSIGDGLRKKICFFSWSPDVAKIREKMVYASSKDSIRKTLDGVQSEIQCADDGDIDYDVVLERLKKATR